MYLSGHKGCRESVTLLKFHCVSHVFPTSLDHIRLEIPFMLNINETLFHQSSYNFWSPCNALACLPVDSVAKQGVIQQTASLSFQHADGVNLFRNVNKAFDLRSEGPWSESHHGTFYFLFIIISIVNIESIENTHLWFPGYKWSPVCFACCYGWLKGIRWSHSVTWQIVCHPITVV